MWDENVYDWTTDYSMNMIIYGPPKSGKTFLAAGKAKQILESNPDSVVYVVNTDKGWAKPALQQGLAEYKDRIVYEYVTTIKKAVTVMTRLKEVVNPHDLIIFDLLSWIWEEAQKEFVNQLAKGDVVRFVANAMQDKEKFGEFSGIQWQYIKKVDDMISNSLSKNPICNIITICMVKDLRVKYKIEGKEEDIWSKLGVPAARPDIAYEFANIIRIQKSDKGNRGFMVVASRDFDVKWEWTKYSDANDFWVKMDLVYGGFEVEKPQEEEGEKTKNFLNLSKADMVNIRKKIHSVYSGKAFTIDNVKELEPGIEPDALLKILDEGVSNGKLVQTGETFLFPVEVEEPVTDDTKKEEPVEKEPAKEEPVEDKEQFVKW